MPVSKKPRSKAALRTSTKTRRRSGAGSARDGELPGGAQRTPR